MAAAAGQGSARRPGAQRVAALAQDAANAGGGCVGCRSLRGGVAGCRRRSAASWRTRAGLHLLDYGGPGGRGAKRRTPGAEGLDDAARVREDALREQRLPSRAAGARALAYASEPTGAGGLAPPAPERLGVVNATVLGHVAPLATGTGPADIVAQHDQLVREADDLVAGAAKHRRGVRLGGRHPHAVDLDGLAGGGWLRLGRWTSSAAHREAGKATRHSPQASAPRHGVDGPPAARKLGD